MYDNYSPDCEDVWQLLNQRQLLLDWPSSFPQKACVFRSAPQEVSKNRSFKIWRILRTPFMASVKLYLTNLKGSQLQEKQSKQKDNIYTVKSHTKL